MRDKLIELLGQVQESGFDCPADIERYTPRFPKNEEVADHLLANGVIAPPCKIGDTVYSINRKALCGHWEDNRYIVDGWSEYKVCEIPFSLTLWECGWKGIFLTREEAEKALANMRGDKDEK